MWTTGVKNWATEQGSGPNLGLVDLLLPSQIRASLGMLRFAQGRHDMLRIAQPQAQVRLVIAPF
jgi:hypothetical protein